MDLAPATHITDSIEPAWHALGRDEVESILGTDERGLTAARARDLLTKYGPNQVEGDRQQSDLKLLGHQFQSPLVIILLVAGVATFLLKEYLDTIVIAAVVTINTGIAFVQERQAKRSVHALLRLVTPRAQVVRDATRSETDSTELVPGDLVLLESGMRVPADIRLVKATSLEVDESTLTGESIPVSKQTHVLPAVLPLADRTNLLHAGTVVTRGRARGYVVATGRKTELGAIAGELRRVRHAETPLQQRMNGLIRIIGASVLVFAVVAFGVGLVGGRSLSEMFLISVALAVSAVPEGLPISFTVTLAAGVRRMARRRAIIRHLPSVETLGSTTIIGSDKTGTLTQNRMVVRQVWAGDTFHSVEDGSERCSVSPGSPLYQTLLAGVLTNEATVIRREQSVEVHGDPTEAALLVAAMAFGLDVARIQERFRVVHDLPFESDRQYSASTRSTNGVATVYVKGAPLRVSEMCSHMLSPDGSAVPVDHDVIDAATHAMASRGLRVLAMAARTDVRELGGDTDPTDLTLLGLQGLADPPRGGARDAIASCRRAGIRVVMITGDHVATATAIGEELGIATGKALALTGPDVETMTDAELRDQVEQVDVYARVTPEQKLRIVRALQQRGEVVAVTGDGVNDAPALRAADIGVAMGQRGTDVAKEAADMVLTDDDFVSIAAAVEEGRIVFANIRKMAFFLLSTNIAEILVILASLALRWPLPLIAAQILWLNLVTDSLPVIALAFEPGSPDVMTRRPYGRQASILSRRLWERLGLSGVVMMAGTLATFRWELDRTGSLEVAQSAALTTMVLSQMAQVFNARSEHRSVLRMNPLGNRLVVLTIGATIVLHLGATWWGPTQTLLRIKPVEPVTWLPVTIAVSALIAAVELHKRARR